MTMLTAEVESAAMLKLNVAKMKELREKIGFTQAQAAAKAGMSVSRWNDIEAGGRSNVTIETLGLIAEALESAPSELLIKVRGGR
jgi:transcriptional regulator with XRE-family HTH domain